MSKQKKPGVGEAIALPFKTDEEKEAAKRQSAESVKSGASYQAARRGAEDHQMLRQLAAENDMSVADAREMMGL